MFFLSARFNNRDCYVAGIVSLWTFRSLHFQNLNYLENNNLSQITKSNKIQAPTFVCLIFVAWTFIQPTFCLQEPLNLHFISQKSVIYEVVAQADTFGDTGLCCH